MLMSSGLTVGRQMSVVRRSGSCFLPDRKSISVIASVICRLTFAVKTCKTEPGSQMPAKLASQFVSSKMLERLSLCPGLLDCVSSDMVV